MAEIIIAKHRNGSVGDVRLRFKGKFARFENPEDDNYIPAAGAEEAIGSKINAAPPASEDPFPVPPPEEMPF